ncbi:MAG TPA: SidA/IucD/PvdA family monooxygenase [Puia sp.]|jgi:lysine N6-hydroxylase|nr:SidA/IucD/PvdA family monooxygenase [Puia sp.]
MKKQTIHDIIGIGIGPFNLGLAALAYNIPNLKCIFFDKQREFNWHAGMLLDGTTLQVPFYADLVTLADPTSQFSYLNFLHKKQRLFRFAFHENNFVGRKEYNEYCRWVVSKLTNVFFGMQCQAIHYNKSTRIYSVTIKDNGSGSTITYKTKHVVIGVGNLPDIPACALPLVNKNIIHSSDYLAAKGKLLANKKITIIGSGQSAAEIFYDILQQPNQFDELHLFSRSERFFPMDYSKLALEMTSPDYIDYFFELSGDKKKKILGKQNALFKGINFSLITDIYDALYAIRLTHPLKKIGLYTNSELQHISQHEDQQLILDFFHGELDKHFIHSTNSLILATGYKQIIPDFLQPVKELIRFNEDGLYDVQKNYSIDKHNSIFVQNAELHTHGFNAPDLGMGPYRNAVIVNTILGKERFKIEKNIAFQTFGVPKHDIEQ